MQEHSLDLLHSAVWLIGVLGTCGLATFLWAVRLGLRRMDAQDRSLFEVRQAIDSVRMLLADELHELRELHHGLDKRVTRIEERCDMALNRVPNNHGG